MDSFFVVEIVKTVMTAVVIMVLGGPFAYFLARRLFGVGKSVAALPRESVELLRSLDGRMTRLESAVDTIAVEVERVTEGQRFTVKLLSDAKSNETPRLGAG
jgi:hypothetical protein